MTVALSGQGADELFGGYRSTGSASLVGRWYRACRDGRSAAPWRARPARRASAAEPRPRGPRPVERLLATSGVARPRPAARARARARSRASTGRRRASASRSLGGRRRRSAARDALPRRPARARRRHAPLLRPGLDGALARGARPVPRPRAGRVLRHDPGGLKVRRLETKHLLKRAGARARARPDHRQAQDRASSGGRRRLAPGADAGRDLRLPARARPHYAEFLDRGALERLVGHYRGGRRDPRAPPDLHPHARDLACHLPPARGGPRASRAARTDRRRSAARDERGRHAHGAG